MSLSGQNLSKQFIRKRLDSNVFYAVDNVSLEVPDGRVTVLAGKSGSGKSTLLNMMSGLLKPDGGKVLLGQDDFYHFQDDRELSRFRNEKFGIIPQGNTAVMTLTVLENVMLAASLYGKPCREKAMELLSACGIGDLKDVLPGELSGGELRRMSVARALINSPEVVFADEPTGDLDEENTKLVMKLLRTYADSSKAVFVVTHDRDVFEYADSVYLMSRGKINPYREEK